MPSHDYTAREALAVLLGKLREVSPVLAERIGFAIDAGKDVRAEETLPPARGRRNQSKRFYRKHIAYTDEEALSVAMTVLESHLIESRMILDATQSEFKHVGLAPPKKPNPIAQPGAPVQTTFEMDVEPSEQTPDVQMVEEPKKVVIEAEPEAVQEKKNLPNTPLQPIDEEQLRSLRNLFEALKRLTDFGATRHGDTP